MSLSLKMGLWVSFNKSLRIFICINMGPGTDLKFCKQSDINYGGSISTELSAAQNEFYSH